MNQELRERLKQLAPHERANLRWRLKRRPSQTPPSPLPFIWVLCTGRGFGKTLTAANHVFDYVQKLPFVPKNRIVRVALIGETFNDIRDTMIEGASGLRSVIPRSLEESWNRSMGQMKVVFPQGPGFPERREVLFFSYTSQEPDKLRGPEHHICWIDEPAKLEDADENPEQENTTWSNMTLGLRAGSNPHIVVTGTPLPCKLILFLNEHPEAVMVHASTLENEKNLPQSYIDELKRLPKASRRYRQEVLGEILFDNPDALFSQENIDQYRQGPPEVYSKVLGYDPSVSAADNADEAGIVLTGYAEKEEKQIDAWVLKDLSGHFTPKQQTQLVIETVLEEKVDDLVFEQNQGVDFVLDALIQALKEQTVEHYIRKLSPKRTDYGTIRRFRVFTRSDSGVHIFNISSIHAKTGKAVRAESVSISYETGNVHHPPDDCLPSCPKCKTFLELQQTSWNPTTGKSSPDRLDALVYTLLFIFGSKMVRKVKTSVAGPNIEDNIHNMQDSNPNRVNIYSADVIGRIYENDTPDFTRSFPSELSDYEILRDRYSSGAA